MHIKTLKTFTSYYYYSNDHYHHYYYNTNSNSDWWIVILTHHIFKIWVQISLIISKRYSHLVMKRFYLRISNPPSTVKIKLHKHILGEVSPKTLFAEWTKYLSESKKNKEHKDGI